MYIQYTVCTLVLEFIWGDRFAMHCSEDLFKRSVWRARVLWLILPRRHKLKNVKVRIAAELSRYAEVNNSSHFTLHFKRVFSREIVTIQIGQCGNQVGTEFWSQVRSLRTICITLSCYHQLCREHDIALDGSWSGNDREQSAVVDRKEVFFYQADDNQYVPRALVRSVSSQTNWSHELISFLISSREW